MSSKQPSPPLEAKIQNEPIGNFVNQSHHTSFKEDQKQLFGTNTVPEDGDHTAGLCQCGHYHSNLSQDALDMRLDYQAILRHGGNPMELMMTTMQFMRACSLRNPQALDELMKDDMKRQQLGVMDEQIEVPIDNTALSDDKQVEFFEAMTAMQQMSKIVAPRVQQNWNEIQLETLPITTQDSADIDATLTTSTIIENPLLPIILNDIHVVKNKD